MYKFLKHKLVVLLFVIIVLAVSGGYYFLSESKSVSDSVVSDQAVQEIELNQVEKESNDLEISTDKEDSNIVQTQENQSSDQKEPLPSNTTVENKVEKTSTSGEVEPEIGLIDTVDDSNKPDPNKKPVCKDLLINNTYYPVYEAGVGELISMIMAPVDNYIISIEWSGGGNFESSKDLVETKWYSTVPGGYEVFVTLKNNAGQCQSKQTININ